jgi:hypothetical protein
MVIKGLARYLIYTQMMLLLKPVCLPEKNKVVYLEAFEKCILPSQRYVCDTGAAEVARRCFF